MVAISGAAAMAGEAPVVQFKDGAMVGSWVVLGALPNEPIPVEARTGPVDCAGLDRDYLGGEAGAEINSNTVIEYTDGAGVKTTATARVVEADAAAGVNFVPLYEQTDNKVAYAFCWVESDADRRVHALFGSDDRAMVWVNGARVHRFDARNRANTPGEDQFVIDLKKGRNRVLVKVENGSGGWSFSMKLVGEEAYAQIFASKQQRELIERVQAAELKPVGNGYFIISPGQFPQLNWSNPELMQQYFGKLETTTRWFDRDHNEVTEAKETGRYGAYVEARSKDGAVIRRGLTFYCVPAGFMRPNVDGKVKVPYLPDSGLTEETWKQAEEWVADFGSEAYIGKLRDDQIGAEFLSGMYDVQEDQTGQPARWMNFFVADQEYHLKLKAKVLGIVKQGLAEPRLVKGEAGRVLREGTLEEAGFGPGLNSAMDELCSKWAQETGIPFTFMVARHGVIAHQGAYGQVEGEAIDTDTVFEVASITKLITGVMLAQFLDQGLIKLDDPIGKYLPDFPTEGPKVMTVRACMMHMAGLEGHGNWGGFNNPWFENSAAVGLDNYEPGKRYIYDGLGLNLVGRIMEIVSGKSFIRLMNENFYQPLGMEHSTVSDTSFGTQTTAHDLGCVGQLLLNQGSYGEHYFFSPATQKTIYPSRVGDFWPESETPEVVYGMGNSWYHDAPTNGAPSDASGEQPGSMGYNTLGHGSATNSVLRVDFDNDLTVTMARPEGGANYSEHMNPILRAIAEHMEK